MNSVAYVGLAALALLVGGLIPVQAATNAAMSRALGHVALAALMLFIVGLAFVVSWVIASKTALPPLSALRQAPPYAFLGGIIVACYVLAITYLAPRLGVSNAICLVVTGQIVAAVIIDHFGLFGASLQALSGQRVLGLLLMVLGVFLARRT